MYVALPATWDYTMLPAVQHMWECHPSTPAKVVSLFAYSEKTKG